MSVIQIIYFWVTSSGKEQKIDHTAQSCEQFYTNHINGSLNNQPQAQTSQPGFSIPNSGVHTFKTSTVVGYSTLFLS